MKYNSKIDIIGVSGTKIQGKSSKFLAILFTAKTEMRKAVVLQLLLKTQFFMKKFCCQLLKILKRLG